jgi:regulator of telomere elongation helicase 1
MALEKKIGELVIESKELGCTKAGSYIYDFLSELNITSDTSKKLIETIDCASLLLEEGNWIFLVLFFILQCTIILDN